MKQLSAILRRKDLAFLHHLQKDLPQAEIFLVGGIVRDTLLGRPSKDYDFVIRRVPLKKIQHWLGRHGRVDLVGKAFGVLKFTPTQSSLSQPIDIALPRTEHALGTGGYRDVEVQSDPQLPIADDLSRRDFTINAMAYDVRAKELIDLYDGRTDVHKKYIRTVGNPRQRFAEDYSRMLRAIRFSCQLGFTIEDKTLRAIHREMKHLNDERTNEYIVPRETIAAEMKKAFMADAVCAFDMYDQTGATAVLMPEMMDMKGCPQPRSFHAEGDVWKHTRMCLEGLYSRRFKNKFKNAELAPELLFAALWHDIGKPPTLQRADRLRFNNHDMVSADRARDIMHRLRLSSAGIAVDQVQWLIRRHMIIASTKKSPMKKTTIEKYFYNDQVPGQQLLMLSYADLLASIQYKTKKPDTSGYRRLEKQVQSIKPKKGKLPPELLGGKEIMRLLDITPGPRVGAYKKKLREAQLSGTVKTKNQAKQYLTSIA